MSDTPSLPPVTVAELTKLVADAKDNPAELERLQSDPEGVLTAMGRSATPGALEFLRSLGETPLTDAPATPVKPRDASNKMAES